MFDNISILLGIRLVFHPLPDDHSGVKVWQIAAAHSGLPYGCKSFITSGLLAPREQVTIVFVKHNHGHATPLGANVVAPSQNVHFLKKNFFHSPLL